jgi:uncharacterized protein (TIGR00297 family)
MFELVLQYSETRLLLGLALAAGLAFAAWRLGALTLSGAVGATLVGGFTYGLGGLPAAILLVAFFGSSSLLSRLYTSRKKKAVANFAKSDRRDWAQAAANGFMPVLALLGGASGLVAMPVAWAAFAAALATVNADTWATELGVLGKAHPRLITTGKRVPPGTSGAVSVLGSLVALGAAFFIGLLAWLAPQPMLFPVLIIATFAGLIGSFFDSYLGAMLQATYYCPKCKKETEHHPLHGCGTKTTLRRGWAWLDNDWVNFLSAVVGALLASGAATFFM